MEWTEQEQERLRAEWKRRAEICHQARQREWEAFMGVATRVALSICVMLMFVGGVSTWLASALFSPKPPPSFEERLAMKARAHNAQYGEAVEFVRHFAR